MGHHDDTQGRFSTGQEGHETPESEHTGDFAEGQEGEHASDDTRRGDFAEGQEDLPHSHALPTHGDFAEGQERDDPHGHGHDHDTTTTTITTTERRAVSRAPHSRRRCRSLD